MLSACIRLPSVLKHREGIRLGRGLARADGQLHITTIIRRTFGQPVNQLLLVKPEVDVSGFIAIGFGEAGWSVIFRFIHVTTLSIDFSIAI